MSPDVAVLDYAPVPVPPSSTVELGVPGGETRYAREREQARASGYAEGWAAGHRDAAQRLVEDRARLDDDASRRADQWRARQANALAALQSAARELHQRQAPTLDDVAGAVLDAALQLAQALLGRELATAGDAGRTALRRALESVGPVRPLEVRLHPADVAALDGVLVPDGVTLVADPSLRSGDAVAQHAGGSVDARLAAGLERARQVLAP